MVRPIDKIRDYLKQYRGGRGESQNEWDEWAVFWDYKCRKEKNGGSILVAENVLETSARLIAYLFLFGMGRGSTRLQGVGSSRCFVKVLEAMHTRQAQQLFHQRFGEVDWASAPFTTVWDDLEKALQAINVSETHTMRSKILLAVWGQIPALDSRFREVFKATGGFWERRPFPANVLNRVREEYVECWRQEIEAAPDEWKHTSGGNRIPDARLIDIAFWSHAGMTR